VRSIAAAIPGGSAISASGAAPRARIANMAAALAPSRSSVTNAVASQRPSRTEARGTGRVKR
jgi:hypothetical protein